MRGAGRAAFVVVVTVALAVLVACDAKRPRAGEPSGAGARAASTSAGVTSSAVVLDESIPPPPSLAELQARAEKAQTRCDAMLETNRRLYEESRKRLGPEAVCSLSVAEDHLGCATTENGVTWGYRLARATAKVPKGLPQSELNCVTNFRVELVRENQAGESTVVPGSELSFETNQHVWVYITLQPLSDYDSDGELELLRTIDRDVHEGDDDFRTQVLTYRGGRVEEYAPSRGLNIEGAKDVDGDGLIDLMSSGPYHDLWRQTDLGNRHLIGPAVFVHHAQKDGRFSMTSPAARAFTAQQCPSRQLDDFSAGDVDGNLDLPQRLACARLWGASAKQIEARFRKVCPTSFEQYEREQGERGYANPEPPLTEEERARASEREQASRSCREWVLDLARRELPFRLAGN